MRTLQGAPSGVPLQHAPEVRPEGEVSCSGSAVGNPTSSRYCVRFGLNAAAFAGPEDRGRNDRYFGQLLVLKEKGATHVVYGVVGGIYPCRSRLGLGRPVVVGAGVSLPLALFMIMAHCFFR